MKRTTNFRPHSIAREERADGSIILRSNYSPGPIVTRTGDWLNRWAREAPDRIFLAERSGAGWREESYLSALEKVRLLAASVLGRGLTANTPIAILSGNGIDHGLLMLAGQYVGIPVVPFAEQYSLVPEARGALINLLERIQPKLVYVADAVRFGPALAVEHLAEVEVVASRPGQSGATPFADLLEGDRAIDVDRAFTAVGPDTVAKILMTSGSTSAPKGVLTTHRMLCVNQMQLAQALPYLGQRPHRIVDWLPWNHVFGGSHNFNMMLANGGSFYIDDGKPLKGSFDRTIENLSMVTGTLAFNVPVGFAMLLDALKKDDNLRRRFFEDLDLIYYAGASLPQDVWDGFETMAMEIKGEVPLLTSSWGMTETAPAALNQQEPTTKSGVVGVPAVGLDVKLIPDDDMRCELRVRGPSIMPGYFNDPDKTRESFDEEGYFITGDAVKFVDPDNPNAGLRFDGRISDDFKLLTGTWVRATNLRIEILDCLAPLASDVVITGHDRSEIGVLIIPNREAIDAAGFATTDDGDALCCPKLLGDIQRRLSVRSQERLGSSRRVGRAVVLAEPPSLADGEMTAKGSLNVHKVLTRRADMLARLYDDTDPAVARVQGK
jgi:feruloyl-CoA synthase